MVGLQCIAVWPAVCDSTQSKPNYINHHGMALPQIEALELLPLLFFTAYNLGLQCSDTSELLYSKKAHLRPWSCCHCSSL